jgi:hypothetical protein
MENYGLIELGLVFGVVLAAAIWELYSVRRGLARRGESKKDGENGPREP